MNKKKVLIIGLLVILLLISMVVYYREELSYIFRDGDVFFKLLLDATQLGTLTWKAFLGSILLSTAAILIDLLALGWSKSGLRRLLISPSGSAKIDIMTYLLSVTKIYEVLYFMFSLGLSYFVASLFVRYLNFDAGGYLDNVFVQFWVLFLVTDFKHYIGHRFMHWKYMWPLHSYHHSATEFTLFTTTRGHLLEAAVYYIITGLFFALLGAPLEVIFVAYALREMYQYLLHSDVNWHLGWIGRWILISPAAHRLHHSIQSEDYDRNYGTFLIWWDRIFGTYKAPTSKSLIPIGIIDNPYNEMGFFRGQWVAMKRFLKIG